MRNLYLMMLMGFALTASAQTFSSFQYIDNIPEYGNPPFYPVSVSAMYASADSLYIGLSCTNGTSAAVPSRIFVVDNLDYVTSRHYQHNFSGNPNNSYNYGTIDAIGSNDDGIVICDRYGFQRYIQTPTESTTLYPTSDNPPMPTCMNGSIIGIARAPFGGTGSTENQGPAFQTTNPPMQEFGTYMFDRLVKPYDIEIHNDTLYASGVFDYMAGPSAGISEIVKYVNGEWITHTDYTGVIRRIAWLDSDLYAMRPAINNSPIGAVYRRNNGTWESTSSQDSVSDLIVASYGGNQFLFAGGRGLSYYNGSDWITIVQEFDSGSISDMEVHGGKLVIGGSFEFTDNGGNSFSRLAKLESFPIITSISEIPAIEAKLLNPSNSLQLTTNKTVDVDVFDLNGRLVRTYNQVSHLNDDIYTNGMYVVVIKDDVNWIAKKLIIN